MLYELCYLIPFLFCISPLTFHAHVAVPCKADRCDYTYFISQLTLLISYQQTKVVCCLYAAAETFRNPGPAKEHVCDAGTVQSKLQ